ncbi:MAG: LysR family transcriptional regulator [Clostridia bacterium]|nr:LysR family transcriptional regulator [Clostridia bacterium]
MNLKQMEYFTAIVNEGSISAAAKALHISQPPLSTQMKLLEEELGLTLFQRGSRSILLTDAGKVFYERAQGILDMTGAAKEELEQMGRGLLGSLCLGTISSVETEPIIGKIAAFRQEHPRVNFRIYEGNTYQLLDKLNTGIIEAAIVRSPFPEEAYDCFYLSGETMMAVGERCFFPNPGADSISLKELCTCPLVVYRRWEGVLNRLFAPDSPNYLCVNDDARTSLTWAETGNGIAVVPASIARRVRPDILMKPLDTQDFTSRITLVYRKNGPLSAVMKEFLDYVSGQLPLS